MTRLLRLLAPLAVLICASVLGHGQERPNVLLIMVDDLRPELGYAAKPYVHSPNMDRLARSGTIFDRAYCQVAVCGASRASMMTGILPTPERFRGYDARADEDFPEAVTLGQAFKESGYTTISLGKILHVQADSSEESWSEPAWRTEVSGREPMNPESAKLVHPETGRGPFFERPDVTDEAYADGKVAARALQTLERLKQDDAPFFLAVGFIKPHLPFYAPKKYWDLYDPEELELASNRYTPHGAPEILRGSAEINSYHDTGIEFNSDEWHRTALHGYLACVSYVDAQVGKILDKLEALDLADNTIIVLVGDHGWHLGEHNFWGKHSTLHNVTRVPLLVIAPRIEGQVSRSDALVGMIDIYPTLSELSGVPAPEDQLQGRSLQALLEGQKPTDWRSSIYSRFGSGDCVVTNGFSYTRFVKNGKPDDRMLFDLHNDPQENWNVVDDPNYARTTQKLDAELDRWMEVAKSMQPE